MLYLRHVIILEEDVLLLLLRYVDIMLLKVPLEVVVEVEVVVLNS
jgi:hypothetical protein